MDTTIFATDRVSLIPLSALKITLTTIFPILKALTYSILASTLAVAYSEILYQTTRHLYRAGYLKRYYPLPNSRHAFTAWTNSMSFTIPTAFYAVYFQSDLQRSWEFSAWKMMAYLAAYMFIHDAWFYWLHRSFHVFRPLYDYFHAMHHEYTHSMQVYLVGYAEIPENFLQVGLAWLLWTHLAGHNYFYWLSPLSFVLFTTLLGHSGYKSHYWLMIFHPFAAPVALAAGRHILTTGDHQMHHSHRRVNFGLFFRFWDQYGGTYKKCNVVARDCAYWTRWIEEKSEERDEQARKWMGRQVVQFEEIEWGF